MRTSLSKGVKTVYRWAPSLSNALSTSDFSSRTPNRTWLEFAGSTNVEPQIIKGHHFSSNTSGKSYSIGTFIKRNTRHVIYLIPCKECNIQYVDRTTRRRSDRLNDHVAILKRNVPLMLPDTNTGYRKNYHTQKRG